MSISSQNQHQQLAAQRRSLQRLDRPALAAYQLKRLNDLLAEILPANRFYAEKLSDLVLPLTDLTQLRELPMTTKQQLVAAADHRGIAGHLTYPHESYVRLHRTSGTHGQPLVILDTAQDWCHWIKTWQYVLDAADVSVEDRALMAFSYGPFIGFWSAHDSLVERGVLAVPTGGMSTIARLELAQQIQATVVCCTPTYALRMAEVARESGFALSQLPVRTLIVAGEPGGSIAAIRARIEDDWQAQVVDHSGATEIGPWGAADLDRRGLHVLESEFIAEFFEPNSDQPAQTGEISELVITSLGRPGAPVIRYRTGDLVRPHYDPNRDNQFVLLEGGILGRTDDMLLIRGVNVYPTAIEAILREFEEVVEFQIIARRRGTLDELAVEVEDRAHQPQRLSAQLQAKLGLRVQVTEVALGSLPRFEAKAKRFVDQR